MPEAEYEATPQFLGMVRLGDVGLGNPLPVSLPGVTDDAPLPVQPAGTVDIQYIGHEEDCDPMPVCLDDSVCSLVAVSVLPVGDTGNWYKDLYFQGSLTPTNSFNPNIIARPYTALAVAFRFEDIVACTLTMQAKAGGSWVPVYDCDGAPVTLTVPSVSGVFVMALTSKWCDLFNSCPEWRFVSSVSQNGTIRMWHR